LLDALIQIEKTPAKLLGELFADRGLAASHKTGKA
jgi:hypothetical protein